MKLFLTSSGLTTDTLRKGFRELLPSGECRVAFIPTAARAYQDTSWLSADIENVRSAGLEVSLVEISTLPREKCLAAFYAADAICFGGGNTYFLLDWVRRSGLAAELRELLKDRVYMGISAGSMIAGPSIESNTPLFPEEEEGKIADLRGLSLVTFAVIPHLYSPSFSKARPDEIQRFASGVPYPVYALDDQSAIEVIDGNMRILSTGRYEAYNTPARSNCSAVE